MGTYILKRILLIIPTILLVLIIAFFLSKWVPGDPAESLTAMQGINSDHKSAAATYEKNYLSLDLEKPLFYFSIVPDFYPGNIHAIVSASSRQQVRAFLHQKIPYEDIVNYIQIKHEIPSSASRIPANNGNTVLSDYSDLLTSFAYSTDLTTLQADAMKLSILYPAEKELWTKLKASIEKMIRSKRQFYYPKAIWHGAENQFHLWLKWIVKGNLGTSIKDGRPVADKIAAALRWTILLVILNILLTSAISIPAGCLAGFKPNGLFDKISSGIWLMLYSMPVFWLASLLIIYCTSDRYGSWLHWFPTPGTWFIQKDQTVLSIINQFSSQLVLPVFCLVANDIAQLSRITRNNIIEQKSRLYVLFARSKGLSEIEIMKTHILPNALIPLVTVIGGKFSSGLSGALLIEVIFNIPGMGRLMYDSINSTDWSVVFGILIIVSIFTIVFMLLTDIVYAWVNPKINYSG